MRDQHPASPLNGSFSKRDQGAGVRQCGLSLCANVYRGVPPPNAWNRNHRPTGEKEGNRGRASGSYKSKKRKALKGKKND